MGKYMRKQKSVEEVAVMDVTQQGTTGVRTRARTLALEQDRKQQEEAAKGSAGQDAPVPVPVPVPVPAAAPAPLPLPTDDQPPTPTQAQPQQPKVQPKRKQPVEPNSTPSSYLLRSRKSQADKASEEPDRPMNMRRRGSASTEARVISEARRSGNAQLREGRHSRTRAAAATAAASASARGSVAAEGRQVAEPEAKRRAPNTRSNAARSRVDKDRELHQQQELQLAQEEAVPDIHLKSPEVELEVEVEVSCGENAIGDNAEPDGHSAMDPASCARSRNVRERTPTSYRKEQDGDAPQSCSRLRTSHDGDDDGDGDGDGNGNGDGNGAADWRPASHRRLFEAPSASELEDFFAAAEDREHQRFSQGYNFDPVNEVPLPGRFEWEKVEAAAVALASTGAATPGGVSTRSRRGRA